MIPNLRELSVEASVDMAREMTATRVNEILTAAIVHTTKALAAKLDEEIGAALDKFWGTGWTPEMIEERCSTMTVPNNPILTFCADGVALLEIYPPMVTQRTITKLEVSQQVRHLR